MIFSLDPQMMTRLMRVSLGKEKADLVIQGGDLVNVYTGELLKNQSVAIKEKWIAYVGSDASHCFGPETTSVDATGKVLIPGLIDGHTHLFYYCTPDQFLRFGMRGGTTTIVTEMMDVMFPFRFSGILELLEGLRDQPIKVFATVPSSSATLSEGFRKRGPSLEELISLLHREDIVGVGEGYWQDVIKGDPNFPALAAEALKMRKSVEGHAAGCHGKRLRAYLDFGVSSCHESVKAEEAVEKLRLGICTMIREGSVRKELKALSKIKDMPFDFRNLALVTDSVEPRELVEKGYMEAVVQEAIDLGFNPITAIQMATINPAVHFHLDHIVGGIAPGKYADIVIIPDVENIEAKVVISNGQVIAVNKNLKVIPRKVELSVEGLKNIRMRPEDFMIPVRGKGPFKIRVIDQITELITRESIVEMWPENGELKCHADQDILKVALITWEQKMFIGYIRNLGIKAGALATSYIWEGFGIIAVGSNEEDMAHAVNRVSEMGGGAVICLNGEILDEIPFSVGGVLSDLPLEEVARRLDNIQSQAEASGFRFKDVLLTLSILTTPAIPFLRLSEDGLVDLKKNQGMDLFIE